MIGRCQVRDGVSMKDTGNSRTERPLTPLQRAFTLHYLRTNNATEAARLAGYKCANKQAHQLLGNYRIQRVLKEERDAQSRRLHLSADQVLAEYARVGLANMADYAEWSGAHVSLKDSSELTRDQTAAIASIKQTRIIKRTGPDEDLITETMELKLWDKMRALKDLGDHLGIFEREDESKAPLGDIHIYISEDQSRPE